MHRHVFIGFSCRVHLRVVFYDRSRIRPPTPFIRNHLSLKFETVLFSSMLRAADRHFQVPLLYFFAFISLSLLLSSLQREYLDAFLANVHSSYLEALLGPSSDCGSKSYQICWLTF